jgi:hypothetical protein
LELRPLPVPGTNQLIYVAKVNPRDSVVVLNLLNGAKRVLKEDALMSQVHPSKSGQELVWQLTAASAVPFDKVDLLVNGTVAWTGEGLSQAGSKTYGGEVKAPAGGWIAARVTGSRLQFALPAEDSYPFAHTAPVWVNHVGSTEPQSARRAARDLLKWMDVADKRLLGGVWDHAHSTIAEAVC